MNSFLEYDFGVKRLIPASVAVFALVVLSPPQTYAQFNAQGTNAGHVITGTAPTVTGPVRPPTGPVRPPTSVGPVILGSRGPHMAGEHRHHRRSDVGPLWYAIPVPYAVDPGPAEDQGDSAADDPDANYDPNYDSNYQGGPTVFDRRGSGVDSYVPPVDDPAGMSSAGPAGDPAPSAPQPTELVFKDGHQLEVVNYAIVGETLFDMTPGHTHRIALASLDLDATRERNEDRGVTFQVPVASQAN